MQKLVTETNNRYRHEYIDTEITDTIDSPVLMVFHKWEQKEKLFMSIYTDITIFYKINVNISHKNFKMTTGFVYVKKCLRPGF